MIQDLEAKGSVEVADFFETLLLTSERKSIPIDVLLRVAREDLGCGDAQASFAVAIMAKRQQVMDDAYPLKIDALSARRVEEPDTYTYTSLLHLTPGSPARQLVHPRSTTEMEVLFERLVAEAAAELWGAGGRALRFGWPSDDGRPQDFAAAVDWLANRMGIQSGRGFRPLTRKDGGVDVIAWHSFGDSRSGVPLTLIQCTLQSDIKAKASDVETRVWGSWLAMDVDPMTALAIPQEVQNTNDWNQLSVRTLVLDRLRLGRLLPRPKTTDLAWTSSIQAGLRAMLEDVR